MFIRWEPCRLTREQFYLRTTNPRTKMHKHTMIACNLPTTRKWLLAWIIHIAAELHYKNCYTKTGNCHITSSMIVSSSLIEKVDDVHIWSEISDIFRHKSLTQYNRCHQNSCSKARTQKRHTTLSTQTNKQVIESQVCKLAQSDSEHINKNTLKSMPFV